MATKGNKAMNQAWVQIPKFDTNTSKYFRHLSSIKYYLNSLYLKSSTIIYDSNTLYLKSSIKQFKLHSTFQISNSNIKIATIRKNQRPFIYQIAFYLKYLINHSSTQVCSQHGSEHGKCKQGIERSTSW